MKAILVLWISLVGIYSLAEYGDYYQGGPTVRNGKLGYIEGSPSDYVFKDFNGKTMWSSNGGWVRGANGQKSGAEIQKMKERMRERKREHDRSVRDGLKNPEFGEYSRPGVYGGYSGHWAGNNQKSVFISSEYGIIYSNPGGWVEGFGPDFEPAQSKWGYGISDDANVYGNIADPNTIRRVTGLEANRLYVVVEANRRFVTMSYRVGDKVVLANEPLASGTLVPSAMLGSSALHPTWPHKLVLEGNGFYFQAFPPTSRPRR